MTNIDQKLLQDTEQFVVQLLAEKLPDSILYHTEDHARLVVTAVDEIGKAEGLSQEELILAKIGAWMHDIGFVESHHEHERESSVIAKNYLEEKGLDNASVKIVENAILSTRIPQEPKDIVSKVLCDSDMYHFTIEEYFELANLMREEAKRIKMFNFDIIGFLHISYSFLNQHTYFTEYGKKILQPMKERTMELMQEKLEKHSSKQKKELKKLKKDHNKLQVKLQEKKGYSRGVESMFRLTARNQINLSAIADNKSNILITVNTLILTIVLTVLVSRFEEYPNIVLPSLVFIATSLITIILAILSTRPQVSSGKFTEHDIKQKSVNLLFFGNFYNMTLDEYDWALREMMKEDDYLYSTMIKDQYALGKVLAKKYKLIRLSFNIFMFGLVITVITFVFSFLS